MLQVRTHVFLLESGVGGKTSIHADVCSTSGILHVAVEIRLAVARTCSLPASSNDDVDEARCLTESREFYA